MRIPTVSQNMVVSCYDERVRDRCFLRTGCSVSNGLVHAIGLDLHECAFTFHVRRLEVSFLLSDPTVDALQTLSMNRRTQFENTRKERKDNPDPDQKNGHEYFEPQIRPRFVRRQYRDDNVEKQHESDDERRPTQPRGPIDGGRLGRFCLGGGRSGFHAAAIETGRTRTLPIHWNDRVYNLAEKTYKVCFLSSREMYKVS